MYPIPPNETLIENRICKQCSSEFPITDKDLEFYKKVSPTFAGKKYEIPAPTLCPDCRQQRRLWWRNERKLYRRTCDATGKAIVSVYSPDKPHIVYHQDFWWGDGWDPLSFGCEFDFKKAFFPQWGELLLKVPLQALLQRNGENSEYTSDSEGNKNCYLCSTSWENENCLYTMNGFWAKDSVDCYWLVQSSVCYECIHVTNCQGLSFSRFCENCTDGQYLVDCTNVAKSCLCIGLRNKDHHFLNVARTHEEYAELISKLQKDSLFRKQCLTDFQVLLQNIPHKANRNTGITACMGDNMLDSSHVYDSYDVFRSENSKYLYQAGRLQDSMDTTITGGNEEHARIYETLSTPGSDSIMGAVTTWDSHDIFYTLQCYNCDHIFGCIGLRNKSYCIFNQQYTKEEYEILVPKIIEYMMKTEEWGEFFPVSFSPFGYNETIAQEYFPLSKEKALKKGFSWSDYEAPFSKVEKIISASKLPESISEIPDDILNWAIECEVSGKPFRIVAQELAFYRKHHLPIPRRHPDQRHLDRMAQRNPRKLFERKCDRCKTMMLTTYAPERLERVYCEECYGKEVI